MNNVKSLDENHIRWFSTSGYYWSSSEYSQNDAWDVVFGHDDAYGSYKYDTDAVRAVLAF